MKKRLKWLHLAGFLTVIFSSCAPHRTQPPTIAGVSPAPVPHHFGFPKPRATKMWVETVDQNGMEIGRWVDIPEPDRFPVNGFSHIESYVSRVLSSTARFTSVSISTPDRQTAVSLWQRDGIPDLGLTVQWRQKPERERSIRQFFADRDFACRQDYLSDGVVPDSTRHLRYAVPPDSKVITKAVRDILHEIYGLRESDALNFTYQERNNDL